jgi:hypothetical protein
MEMLNTSWLCFSLGLLLQFKCHHIILDFFSDLSQYIVDLKNKMRKF